MPTQTLTTTDKTTLTTSLDATALYAAYFDSLDATPSTERTYRGALNQWASYLKTTGQDELKADRQSVIAYKTHLISSGYSANSVNAYLAAVRSLYRWLEAERIYPNITAAVKGLRHDPHSPKEALTKEQARRLLTLPTGDSLEAKRNRAIIALMLHRGLRVIEVARADIGDIIQTGGRAVLKIQGKGYADKSQFVVLADTVLKPLADYLNARGETSPDAPLFAGIGNRNAGGRLTTRSVSRIVQTALKAAGVASRTITAHSLRHTAVTFALLGGASIQEAQGMARHTNVATTLIYAHNLDRLEGRGETAIDRFLAA